MPQAEVRAVAVVLPATASQAISGFVSVLPMKNKITLRDVQDSDLPIFFEQQLEPEATRMAAFAARGHDAFMTHWKKILIDKTTTLKTIIFQGNVAENIVCWDQRGECKVGFWLGKEYWGRGIASAALAQFLGHVKARPVYAHVARHNAASIRVLQKCGFTIFGEDTFVDPDGAQDEEFVLALGASPARLATNAERD